MLHWVNNRSGAVADFSGPVIRIDNAVVAYREGVALDGVSLEVGAGEFVGLIGPNGAGKTTLLKLINGLIRPQSGRVSVFGAGVERENSSRIRKQVGYVAQVRSINPRLPISVRETVMVGAFGRLGLLRYPGAAERRLTEAVLEMVGLSRLAGRPLGHLSGGEQQKVAIARALVQEPKILLLDEPTVSLDREARRDIVELTRMVHEARGLTTVFVTHDFEALPENCRRIVVMRNGRIWRDGGRDAVLDEETLAELFAGRSVSGVG